MRYKRHDLELALGFYNILIYQTLVVLGLAGAFEQKITVLA